MVVGNGDIAKVLPQSEKHFFASGVSNSQEKREGQYIREENLLFKQPRSAHLVYFSTLALFYSDTRYTQHKRSMEVAIKENFPLYTIIRLGNITWGKNPNTLINYLRVHPEADVRDEYRYVIEKDEFLHWIDLIPNWSCEMNLTGQRMKVKKIKEKYVKNT